MNSFDTAYNWEVIGDAMEEVEAWEAFEEDTKLNPWGEENPSAEDIEKMFETI